MALLLAILIGVAWGLAGNRLAAACGCRLASPGESIAVGVTLGMGINAWVMTALAFAGGLYPVTGWIVLALLYAVSWRQIPLCWRALRDLLRSRFRGVSRKQLPWLEAFGGAVLIVLLILAVTLAWAPPLRTDALVYHLAVPKAYLDHHGVVNLPNNMYSFFPLLFEMVYLFGLTFEVEGLPALLGVGQAVALAVGLATYYRRYLGGRYGWLVAAVFFSVPTFVEIAASAYVDLPLAGFVFFAFYAWDRWRETRHGFWFALMCGSAASAFATKLTGFMVLPLTVLGIVWVRRHGSAARALGEVAVFTLTALVFMAPWWARNLHYAGNPFVPLFMQMLGGQEQINWDPTRAMLMDRYVHMFGMGRGIVDFLLLPYNLTFHSEPHSLRFDGRLGLVYFLLIPAGVGVWMRRTARIGVLALMTAVLILVWFLYFQYIRFLAPALTFLSLLGVYGLETLVTCPAGRLRTAWNQMWMGLIALGLVFNTTLAAKTWWEKRPTAYLSGDESRDAYWTRNLPAYPMYRAMNTQAGADDRVLFIYMRNLGYLAQRDFLSDSIFEAHTMQSLLARADAGEDLFQQLQSLGVTHIMFDSNYVWGPDSTFTPEHQARLQRFLMNHAERIARNDSYALYRIVIN
ncbi:ArnT family glycosyltransferase [Nitrospina watsonii]|uniref:Glycosyltransferase RgtA/B/C/D-like domain-containing protein n=1 Tax=Nitrospina watsonii TaxID=1323948 RepID=A0ABM9HGD2_9BACT|nr:hypothetical protein [Nitrospina watsonii]CAI2719111.1 conserved membrane protein of unknown function [Nitrospina watsonii]